MSPLLYDALAVLMALGVLLGIHLMNSPKTAIKGNIFCAVCISLTMIITMVKDGSLDSTLIWGTLIAGTVIGMYIAIKVKMIQMPQLVAILNGIGGAASVLVGWLLLVDTGTPDMFSRVNAGLAIIVGSTSFAGSLIAAAKLHQLMTQKPVHLKNHTLLCALLIISLFASLLMLAVSPEAKPVIWTVALVLLAHTFGALFTLRVGGADMPITISLLISFSGVASGITGLAIADPMLVALGGIVGSSGLLLTKIMCRALNRNLTDILLGKTSVATSSPASAAAKEKKAAPQAADPAALLAAAKKVIIVPGYGMALAQAQHKVKQLADALEAKGAEVVYAIHPVAGRMPGHMNVLLAEADVDYEKLLEMDAANALFADTDLALVIGANDVINPAANEAEGTPIYGMPILNAAEAKNIIICNYDNKPGYAGVENPLYSREGVIMLSGDAAASVGHLLALVMQGPESDSTPSGAANDDTTAAKALSGAQKVVIVPGYGMALAQAQHKVKQLADALEANGAEVVYAIHPVAGRMPGHMNVLLAEADVDYEKLLEMDAANALFAETDLALVIGANDVINPAANEAEGTPIYGMPILNAAEARNIIICNYDDKPGYAGVENPLYSREGVIMLSGDAAASVGHLLALAMQGSEPDSTPSGAAKDDTTAAKALSGAKKVVIVPGYGMALAQAQHKVKQLADALEAKGAEVVYAIHPVAGRMPGHMNVLLAEADVDYEKLLEMDAANALFAETDLALVIGANDVINPAANEAEGTPIYGMPILNAAEAKNIIICNYDDKPGYAGVDNPLYTRSGVSLLLGDAGETLERLIRGIQ